MIDREKVIKGLKCCSQVSWLCPTVACPYYRERHNCSLQLKKDAFELLKEQEALKPTVSVDTWICSQCGHTLESQELIDDKENPQVLIHEQYNYCPNCGRAVKWNEAD